MSDGYHSSDYNHDWSISGPELLRTTALYNTKFSGNGLRSGCYKVDKTSIDGFAPDPSRDPSLPVELEYYHSADYDKDGNIDEAEIARVTFLYQTTVDFERTGEYHISPDTVDGFDQYIDCVLLSSYQFDEKHLPVISSSNSFTVNSSSWYKLRAKFIDGSANGFMGTEEINNNQLALQVVPPPGVYQVELYWIQFTDNGDTAVIGVKNKVQVIISPAAKDDNPYRCTQCPEFKPGVDIPPVLEDQGICHSPSVHRSCNAPDLPETPCNNEKYITQYDPNSDKPFTVVASLKDATCQDILDESDRTILTVIQ